MDDGNQGDHKEEPIHKETEHEIGVSGVPVQVQPVIKTVSACRQPVEFLYILFGCVFGQLNIQDRIGILAGDLLKQSFGTDDRRLIRGAEGAVFENTGYHEFSLSNPNGVPCPQRIAFIKYCQHTPACSDSFDFPLYQVFFGPCKLLVFIGNQIDLSLFSLILCGEALIHPSKGPLDIRQGRHFFGETLFNFTPIVRAAVKDIRGPGAQGVQRKLDPLNQDRKAQNHQDAEGKGTRHQQQIFGRGYRMVDAQRRLDSEEPSCYRAGNRPGAGDISGHRCHR